MKDNYKLKKNLNVSLQSKKYTEPINKIIKKWEDEGINISVQICELILLFDKYNKSLTLSNIKNVFELIEKMVSLYAPLNTEESEFLIEEILSDCIKVDNNQLTLSLSKLNKRKLEILKDKEPLITNKKDCDDIKDELVIEGNRQETYKTMINTEVKNNTEIKNNTENEIPMDFLINS